VSALDFDIRSREGAARTGVLTTPRGAVHTPAFMPLATGGAVKAMTVAQTLAAGAEIILGNTYHLMLRPGSERIARLGGLHRFMGWERPILTDSGGFQVMSLSKIARVEEDGVTFQSHIDGSRHALSPERAIEIQADQLGADIVMQLDECLALPAGRDRVADSMRLSGRWAARCKTRFGQRDGQALFGIQQGGLDPALRRESAERLVELGFDGYAVGGLAVGEGTEAMCEALEFAPAMLPEDRPRYLMGVGKPADILEAVWRGVDMFDCVLPTRSGRHGQAWTWDGAINLRNARFVDDPEPLDASSDCPASRDYSKAYLHHLVKASEILGQVLLSWHNVAFFEALMAEIRQAIAEGRLAGLHARFGAGAGAAARL
jgi:queuine tRNA-ribosyltransferase